MNDVHTILVKSAAEQFAVDIDNEIYQEILFCHWYKDRGYPENHPIKRMLRRYLCGAALFIASDKKNKKIVFYRYPNADKKKIITDNFYQLEDILINREKRSYVTINNNNIVTYEAVWSEREYILLSLMNPDQRRLRLHYLIHTIPIA